MVRLPLQLLTDAEFKQATWDYVQDTGAATTKWGDIGDWDTSGVGDFSHSLSKHRNQAGGTYVNNGNPKAVTFVGTAISKWDTASATTLDRTFYERDERRPNRVEGGEGVHTVRHVPRRVQVHRDGIEFVGHCLRHRPGFNLCRSG